MRKIMKTLYVSDLDGTLLTGSQTVTDETKRIINHLISQGMCFSYATARSVLTAEKVTEGLVMSAPLIVYNGTFLIHHETGEILLANYFDAGVTEVFTDLFSREVFPLVYSIIDGAEKFSFIKKTTTRGMDLFLESRKGDVRTRLVHTTEELMKGDPFYITCMDEPEKLRPLYEKYKEKYHCVYSKDIYTKEQWLEIMPQTASKANAVLQLKQMMGFDRLVVFGDGKNDLDMFAVADECYAVENAVQECKEKATAIIGSHEENAVAKWLQKEAAW